MVRYRLDRWGDIIARETGQVYMFYPGPVDKLHQVWSTRIHTSQFRFDPNGDIPPPPIALGLINRLVRTEFQHVLRGGTTKHFHDVQTLTKLLPVFRQRIPLNALRHISLGFSNREYFRLLGVPLALGPRSYDANNSAPIDALRNLPSLTSLHFHFQVHWPRSTGREIFNHDPWAVLNTGHPNSKVSCQKQIVDWIFTLALPRLRPIPLRPIAQITFSGHVKHSTRTEWERIFMDERRGYLHDMTARINAIIATPNREL